MFGKIRRWLNSNENWKQVEDRREQYLKEEIPRNAENFWSKVKIWKKDGKEFIFLLGKQEIEILPPVCMIFVKDYSVNPYILYRINERNKIDLISGHFIERIKERAEILTKKELSDLEAILIIGNIFLYPTSRVLPEVYGGQAKEDAHAFLQGWTGIRVEKYTRNEELIIYKTFIPVELLTGKTKELWEKAIKGSQSLNLKNYYNRQVCRFKKRGY